MLTSRQWWTTRQVMPTRHKGGGGRGAVGQGTPQQGRLQIDLRHQISKDRIQPWSRRMALWFFCPCLDGSIRPVSLTSCQWWHWCNVVWTRWCQFQTPRTDPQLRHPEPEIPRLRPEGPGLQWGDTGRWMSPGVPHDPGLLSEDHLHQSSPRDGSPVNFSTALDTAENGKDKSFSDDEDEEGSSRKVSSAQYQLFCQAATSSKGSYKLNPSKSWRAARASLMDLGDEEVTDRVSWLDQPSLIDTMTSTVRIAQGLKEDEDVEKTTLSETLNTGSFTFKHLTVKHIFPWEPYRLKVHRDAQYLPKPPAADGFSDNKPPSSYQISHHMSLDTRETRGESRHLCVLSGLNGGVGDRGAFTEGPENQVTARELGDHTRSPGFGSICRIHSSLQSAVAMAGRTTQELWFSTASPEYGEDGTFRGSSCPGSWTQGSAEQGSGHPASG